MSAAFATRVAMAGYMYNQLGRVALQLGYPQPAGTDESVFEEEVNQVLLECAATTPAEIANPLAARALAAMHAWRRACDDLASQYTFALDGARYDRAGLYDKAARSLARAETAALPYSPHYTAQRTTGGWQAPTLGLG